MDRRDIKLLAGLLLNSRASIKSLAKKAGVSREVALYRIKNLNKQIIRDYYTIIDLNALGYRRYGCFMQFKGITSHKEEGLISDIANHPFVNYLGPILGKWNVVFDIHAKDEIHLKSILDEMITKAGAHIDSYLINSPGTDYSYFPMKYAGEKQIYKKKSCNKVVIDDTDKKILHLLSKNSRADYVELSKTTKLSPNAIKYRIKNMEKINLIQEYTVSIDYTKLGLQFFNVQLKLTNLNDKKLIAYIINHPNIIYYYKYIGQENWDMDIGIISKDSEEFRKIIIDIKKEFGEILKIHEIYMISHMIKDNIAPEGVFN